MNRLHLKRGDDYATVTYGPGIATVHGKGRYEIGLPTDIDLIEARLRATGFVDDDEANEMDGEGLSEFTAETGSSASFGGAHPWDIGPIIHEALYARFFSVDDEENLYARYPEARPEGGPRLCPECNEVEYGCSCGYIAWEEKRDALEREAGWAGH